MTINLEINNKTKSPIDKINFEKIAECSIKKNNLISLDKKNIEISLAFISEKEIKNINRYLRKKDEPTDILSFPEFLSAKQTSSNKDKKIFLGELLMCYDNIKKYSKKEKLDFKKELAKVFSHGVLHLLGLKHGRKMFNIANEATDVSE